METQRSAAAYSELVVRRNDKDARFATVRTRLLRLVALVSGGLNGLYSGQVLLHHTCYCTIFRSNQSGTSHFNLGNKNVQQEAMDIFF